MKASDFRTGLLKAADLSTTPVTVEIVNVTKREFDGVSKVVLFTTGFSGRGMTLNQTRLDALAEAFGDETDNWVGKSISVRRGAAMFKGSKVGAIEVTPISPGGQRASLKGAPTPPPPHGDYEGPDDGVIEIID